MEAVAGARLAARHLLARRPDVREAERAFAAATARIGVAQAARLPTIRITGYYGSQSGTAGDLFTGNTEIYQLQAGISIPLFTGGRLANEARAARARAEQARLQFEQTVLQALREASDALVAVRTARDQLVAQQTQVVALRRRRSWPISAIAAEWRATSRCSTPSAAVRGRAGTEPDAAAGAQLGGGVVPGAGRELESTD